MIIHRSSKEQYRVEFHPLTRHDVKKMVRDGGPQSWETAFDWSLYFRCSSVEVHKMVITGNDEIQGCIALEIKEDHVYVHLIESAPHNFKGKEFLMIGEHLLGFACRRSQQFGFEGAVALQSKTGPKYSSLIGYYTSPRIGAAHLGNGYMILDGLSAQRLIMLYSE